MKKVFNLLNLSVPGETYEVAKGHYTLQKEGSSTIEVGNSLSSINIDTLEHTQDKLIVGQCLYICEFHRYYRTSPIKHILKASKNRKSFILTTRTGSKYILKVK